MCYSTTFAFLIKLFLSVSLIRTLSPFFNGFSVCPVYIYFESCLFGLFSMFVVSSFGTSVLNVLLIGLAAGAGDPSRNGAVRNISSVILGSSLVRRDFCSALLMVCMFHSKNPFDLGYLGLEVICLKFHSWENVLY